MKPKDEVRGAALVQQLVSESDLSDDDVREVARPRTNGARTEVFNGERGVEVATVGGRGEVGQRDDDDAGRTQDAPKLRERAKGVVVSHVLEHQKRVDEVDGGVRERDKPATFDEASRDVVGRDEAREHLGRDVETSERGRRYGARERDEEPADAAAVLHDVAARVRNEVGRDVALP